MIETIIDMLCECEDTALLELIYKLLNKSIK